MVDYQLHIQGRIEALSIHAYKGNSCGEKQSKTTFFRWAQFHNTYSLGLFHLHLIFFAVIAWFWWMEFYKPPFPSLLNPGGIKLIPLLHDWVCILFRCFSDHSSQALWMSSLGSWIPLKFSTGLCDPNSKSHTYDKMLHQPINTL